MGLEALSREEREELVLLLEEQDRRRRQRKLLTYFPDEGPLRRALYPKHMEFFAAGKVYRERGFMAANRVGKTESGGGYELAVHATGRYPAWWPGRRWNRPVHAWAAGASNETARDIVAAKLFGATIKGDAGRKTFNGEGLVPFADLGKMTWKQGLADFPDVVRVKHVSGGWSSIGLKSYEQGRTSFEGVERDIIWLDEEPDEGIYGECIIRTATCDGMVMLTFTPLLGLTPVALSFLPGGAETLAGHEQGMRTYERYTDERADD